MLKNKATLYSDLQHNRNDERLSTAAHSFHGHDHQQGVNYCRATRADGNTTAVMTEGLFPSAHIFTTNHFLIDLTSTGSQDTAG